MYYIARQSRANRGPATPKEDYENKRLLKGYLIGQICNVAKVSVWWTAFTPLVFALLHSDVAVGANRVAFNLALLCLSPIAGVLAERLATRKILLATTCARMVIWSALLPCAYFAFMTGGEDDSAAALSASSNAMYWSLLVFSLLDGASVAFANVVDIDMGGLDLLAGQHGVPVGDRLRNKFNAVHQLCFDGSMIAFAPAMALVSYALAVKFRHGAGTDKDPEDMLEADAGGIVLVFALVFFVLSAVSLYYYKARIPKRRGGGGRAMASLASADGNARGGGGGAGDAEEPNEGHDAGFGRRPAGVCGGLVAALRVGAGLCWRNRPVRYRLLFLACEVALEDAMVAVVCAEFAMTSYELGGEDAAKAAIWTAALVAVGKVGAVCAGAYMHRRWKVPRNEQGYRPLFYCVLGSSVAVALLPLGHAARPVETCRGALSHIGTRVGGGTDPHMTLSSSDRISAPL